MLLALDRMAIRDGARVRAADWLPRGAARGYVVAVLAVALATIVAVALGLRLDPVAVAPYLAAVAAAAALGGFGPALVGTVLSTVLCHVLFLAPLRRLDLDEHILWRLTTFRLGVFVAAALVITAAAALRRRTEDELRRVQRQMLRFVADPGVALLAVDADGAIVWADDGARAALRWHPHELVGRTLSDLLVDGGAVTAILACREDEHALENRAVRVRCGDGTARTALVNVNGSWTVPNGTSCRVVFALVAIDEPATADSPGDTSDTDTHVCLRRANV